MKELLFSLLFTVCWNTTRTLVFRGHLVAFRQLFQSSHFSQKMITVAFHSCKLTILVSFFFHFLCMMQHLWPRKWSVHWLGHGETCHHPCHRVDCVLMHHLHRPTQPSPWTRLIQFSSICIQLFKDLRVCVCVCVSATFIVTKTQEWIYSRLNCETTTQRQNPPSSVGFYLCSKN